MSESQLQRVHQFSCSSEEDELGMFTKISLNGKTEESPLTQVK